ncbi:hypothetical protein DEM27_24270 [Metarhizobium album]|uniref:HTH cro/C1-type domain-containing protein n=1 Tax=Metarhizobium album TaxID=2182425 RepID=A0A2U2DKD9_9HYPH|nr:hypothetical protein DEM27_24270 [Rhizobium album]
MRNVDDIRKIVRLERKRRGLTQARASGLTGFSQKWLSEFERGHVNPPVEMVLKILTTLGIRLNAEIPGQKATSMPDDEATL